MIHQSPGLTEKHKTTHTPIGYFLASVSDSQKYRQEKRSHWARGLRWIFRGQRALSISVIYRMQENDSRCARGTKNTAIWKHDEGMQPCVVSFPPASSVQSSNMCVSTAVSSSTISCIIIRQIQLQRFFFSFSLRRSSNEKSSTSTFQSYPKPKIFWQMPKHLLWTV